MLDCSNVFEPLFSNLKIKAESARQSHPDCLFRGVQRWSEKTCVLQILPISPTFMWTQPVKQHVGVMGLLTEESDRLRWVQNSPEDAQQCFSKYSLSTQWDHSGPSSCFSRLYSCVLCDFQPNIISKMMPMTLYPTCKPMYLQWSDKRVYELQWILCATYVACIEVSNLFFKLLLS